MPLTVRMRRSPFWASSHQHSPHGYLVYNNMLIASYFGDPEEEYHHLKSHVQLWDVGCERQIEVCGSDASRLVQMSTPRDISKMRDDQCYYIPTIDGDGAMTNDPVLVRLEEDRYWVSISDSDLILFYKGVAAAHKLNVTIHEPDVFPLGIQGPKADELAARVWGDQVRDIRFFRHKRVNVNGKDMILARSGFSTQGGFELYYEGTEGGNVLWDQLMEAGHDLGVRAGVPHQSERIESGLLSYLSDITQDMTPFEAGLGNFCEMENDVGCLGWKALKEMQKPFRQIRPIEIEGEWLPPQSVFWKISDGKGNELGRISSSCRSYSHNCNAAIGLVNQSHWDASTQVVIHLPDGNRVGRIVEKFWGR